MITPTIYHSMSGRTLLVRVVEAELDTLPKSYTPSPFCVVKIAGQAQPRFETDVLDFSTHPKWDESCTLTVKPGNVILVSVCDDVDGRSDVVVGATSIPASEVKPGAVVDDWFNLVNAKDEKVIGGVRVVIRDSGPAGRDAPSPTPKPATPHPESDYYSDPPPAPKSAARPPPEHEYYSDTLPPQERAVAAPGNDGHSDQCPSGNPRPRHAQPKVPKRADGGGFLASGSTPRSTRAPHPPPGDASERRVVEEEDEEEPAAVTDSEIVTPERRYEQQLDEKAHPQGKLPSDRLPPTPERSPGGATAPGLWGTEERVSFLPEKLIKTRALAVQKQAQAADEQIRSSKLSAVEAELPRYRAVLLKNQDLIGQASSGPSTSPITLMSQMKVAIRITYDLVRELSEQLTDSAAEVVPPEPLPEDYRPMTPSVRVTYVRPATATQRLCPERPTLRRSNTRTHTPATRGTAKSSSSPVK
jgi:hypothetical protein